MFSIELMTGAMIFKLLHLLIAVVVIYNVFAIVKKVWFTESEEPLTWKTLRTNLFVIAAAMVLIYFGSGVSAPKITLDVPKNRDLIEYQSNQTPVQVNPVQPRYEVLDGFTPLKQ